MMRDSLTTPRQRASAALVALIVALVLTACASTPPAAVHVAALGESGVVKKAADSGIQVVGNVQYGTASSEPLDLDVCLPAASTNNAPRAAIVSIHGGTWRAGNQSDVNWRSVCTWLASEGFVTFSVGYRLAPQHPYPAGFDDVQNAVRWIRSPTVAKKYNIDPARIGAFGGSAGGNLASLLGTEGSGSLTSGARVLAVAELSGPSNLTSTGAEEASFVPLQLAYLGCSSFAACPQARKASPLFQVDSTDSAFFIAHSATERIPISQSTDFVSALKSSGADVTVVTMPGSLHSIAMLDDSLRAQITEFFHSRLDAPAAG